MARRPRSRVFLGALLVLALSPATQSAFSNVEVGDPVDPAMLRGLDGQPHPLLGEPGEVSVFLFFRPGHAGSLKLLEAIEGLRKAMAEDPVHWVAVVSDRFDRAEAERSLTESAFSAPVLLDEGDALYGHLGVALLPVVGVVNGEGRLTAYQPFQKINYAKVIEARVRHALGQIDDDALAEILDPPAARLGGEEAVALRGLRLAQMLLKSKNYPKAKEQALKAVDAAPELAAAHRVLGQALKELGECSAALDALNRALELDPEDEEARATRDACLGER